MAIAFDNSGYLNFNSTSGNTSFTITGNDCLLLVFTYTWAGNDDITSVTYDGNAMTQLGSGLTVSGNKTIRPFYYYVGTGPGTGKTIAVSRTGSADTWNVFASYSGVKQSGFPDAEASSTTSTSPYTRQVTTTVDNCWTVLMAGNATPAAQTASTGSTFRQNNTSGGYQLYDSNGAITPAGSNSMSWTQVIEDNAGGWIVSLAPVPAGPANIKTVNGVAIANVKTVNDVAKASVKTINGVA